MDRAVAKKKENAGSFTGVRYRREPFGGDLAAMEINRRGDVEEGEAMEMQSLPQEAEARADVHANPDDEIQLADEIAADHDEFVNPIGNLNIDR